MTTKRFIALVVIVVLAAGLFVAFTTQPWDTSGGGSSTAVYTAGQAISVDKGDTFVITLDSNPTTGYQWQAEDNAKVEQVKSKYVAGDSNLIGHERHAAHHLRGDQPRHDHAEARLRPLVRERREARPDGVVLGPRRLSSRDPAV